MIFKKKIIFRVLILIGIILNPPVFAAEVNEVDSNFDGKVDQWQHLSPEGKVLKIEHDSDFDGKIEQVEYFKGDKKLVRVEFDRNQDGKVDHFQYYKFQD